MFTRNLRAAMTCALLSTTALAAPAFAQVANTAPPLHQTVDDFGVDLLSGQFRFAMTEATIGSGKGALSLMRYYGDSGYRDNWSNGLYLPSTGPVSVEFGDYSDTFLLSGGAYINEKGNGATLSTGLLYTTADGTQIQYSNASPNWSFPMSGYSCTQTFNPGQCAIPVSVTKPDGTVFTLNWDIVERCAVRFCTSGSAYYRFRGVTSSAGYSFTVNYVSNAPGVSGVPPTNWWVKSGVSFANSVTACSGECPSLTYSLPGSVITVTDALSRVWTFTNGTGIRRPGESSDSTSVTYGTGGAVASVTHDGVTRNYSRSVVGSTSTMTVTDALGHTKVITGDLTKDQITSVQDELGHTTSYQYDGIGRVTQITQPEGNYVQYAYDGRGNVTTATAVAKSGSGLSNIVTSANFPSTCTNTKTCNEPTYTIDAKGNQTDYTYDSNHGGVLTITRPAPTTGAVRPQVRNTYTQITSAGGNLVYMLTGVSACQTGSSCTGTSDEAKSTIAYNSSLLPTSKTSGDGTGALAATEAYTYDAAGNRLTVDGPMSGTADTTSFRYDADHELTGEMDPDPDGPNTGLNIRALQLTYRSDGQVGKKELGTITGSTTPSWSTFAAAQTIDIGFDTHARPITSKLSAGGVDQALTQTSYDTLGRANCIALRMNTAIYGSLPSDACTLGTQGSFGPDRITQTVFDNASDVTQVNVGAGTSDAATERAMAYSNNGKLTSLTDGESNKTTYVYDGFDRLSQTQYPNTTKGAGTSNSSDYDQLSYDANGNVTSHRLRDGYSIAFTFDNLNRVTLKDLPGSEPDVSYAYDNRDRLTSASQTGNALSFTYDALSRKLTEQGPEGTATSQYDLAGRRTQLTYPGSGLYVNYDYLVTGNASKIRENGANSGVGVLATYAYDDLGRRTSVTFGNGASQAFTYDGASRLASLTNDLSGTANDLSVTFSYSPASQITSTVRTGDTYAWTGHGNGTTTFTQNGLNQQITVGGTSTSWDSKGNFTSEPQSGKTYCYSSENLLISSGGTCAAPSVTLAYDPHLRLYQVAGTTTTRFAYDGVKAIADYDGSSTLQHRYVFGPGVDQPVVQYDGSGTTNRDFMGIDERGTVVSLTDSSGSLININRYDEFGKPQGTNTGRFQFTGQKWIGEANVYDYKARAYLAHLGIFGQTDPAGYRDTPNLYAYVANDPVNAVDPLGLNTVGDLASGATKPVEIVITASVSEPCEVCNSSQPLDSIDQQSIQDSLLVGSNTGEQVPIVVTGPAPQKPIVIVGPRPVVVAQWMPLVPPNIDILIPHLFLPGSESGCVEACFEVGTLVATPTGLRPIEEIVVGDLVLSKDEHTGEVAAKEVTRLIRPEPKPIYELALRDVSAKLEKFHATGDHRWEVRGKGWVQTSELTVGERIETGLKTDVTVASVSLTDKVEHTYNLEVAGWHTFMVGEDHAVVHNGCPDPVKEAQRLLNTNSAFKNWFHKVYKEKMGIGGGADARNPDMLAEEVLEAYEEWVSEGRPGA